ncbi:11836_t:CDS:2, partial [Cetraspora pellucida]
NGIECEYSIIKTIEKFNEIEKLGLSTYVAQLEYTSNKIGDTKFNIYYAKKKYNKCENYKKNECKCHYKEDKNYICEVCTPKCSERTISRIEGLSSSVSPFEFGNFHNLASSGYEKMQKDKKTLKKRLREGRFWHPVVFYFYGPGGSGKSGLVTELFGNELFNKQEKMRSGSSWWNSYEGQDILFLDEFYTKIDWGTMVNLLNDTNHEVQSKYGGYKSMVVKYIFMTNTKSPEDAYNFGNNVTDNDSNKRNLQQFEKYEEKFCNIEWDVKYRNGEFGNEEIKKKEFKKNYLRDYPKCRKLFQYKIELNNNNKRNNDDNGDYKNNKEIGESSNTMNDIIEEINDSRNNELIDNVVEFLIETDDDDDNKNYIIVNN